MSHICPNNRHPFTMYFLFSGRVEFLIYCTHTPDSTAGGVISCKPEKLGPTLTSEFPPTEGWNNHNWDIMWWFIYSFEGSLNIGRHLLNQEKTLHNYFFMTHPKGTLWCRNRTYDFRCMLQPIEKVISGWNKYIAHFRIEHKLVPHELRMPQPLHVRQLSASHNQ